MNKTPMDDAATPQQKKTNIPLPLPRNLHSPPRGPRFAAIGGPVGMVILLMTVATLIIFGWIAWGKYGAAVHKVFAKNVSSSYNSRLEYFKSRLEAIDAASRSRRFGFYSKSIAPKALKVYYQGDILTIDASDALGDSGAADAAKEIGAFTAQGGSIDKLTIEIPPPRDNTKIAQLLGDIFIKVMDGAEESQTDIAGGALHEITMNDVVEK